MEISPRRSLSLDFQVPIASSGASSYPPTFTNCRSNMYTMQGSSHSLLDPINHRKAYRSTSNSFSIVSNPETNRILVPKKENFFNSMFGALTSIFADRFVKIPSSFMSNLNNTLSVTLVPNEGIISQDFFKNLTQNRDQLISKDSKESQESIKSSARNPTIINDSESSVSNNLNISVTSVSNEEIISEDFFKNLTQNRDQLISKDSQESIKSSARNPTIINDSESSVSDLNISVTSVPNEELISQDFLKNLTQNRDQLISKDSKESQESIKSSARNPTIINDSESSVSNLTTKNSKTIDSMNKILNSEEKEIDLNDFYPAKSSSTFSSDYKPNNFDIKVKIDEKETKKDSIFHDKTVRMNFSKDETIKTIKEDRRLFDPQEKKNLRIKERSKSVISKFIDCSTREEDFEEEKRNPWQRMWRKVVSGMANRLNPRCESPESEVPRKKPNLSKPRRKTFTVARCRGRGRGKSQLRRSGVSQSRHRKERTKQNIYSNIQDDLDAWEDFERYDESGNDDSQLPNPLENEEQTFETRNSNFVTKHCPTIYESCNFGETAKFTKRRQRASHANNKCPVRVRYLPETLMEVQFIDRNDCNSKINEFRPRLVSESSVDSEDSCYIVFEHESESDSEFEDDNYDDVGHTEFTDDENMTGKVRFNLEPTIHTMIKWDFAYRAARRGPWEEMARDRERFRGRINCIGRVLDPILSTQHRKSVFHDRFSSSSIIDPDC